MNPQIVQTLQIKAAWAAGFSEGMKSALHCLQASDAPAEPGAPVPPPAPAPVQAIPAAAAQMRQSAPKTKQPRVAAAVLKSRLLSKAIEVIRRMPDGWSPRELSQAMGGEELKDVLVKMRAAGMINATGTTANRKYHRTAQFEHAVEKLLRPFSTSYDAQKAQLGLKESPRHTDETEE